jgi:hypothetical protein
MSTLSRGNGPRYMPRCGGGSLIKGDPPGEPFGEPGPFPHFSYPRVVIPKIEAVEITMMNIGNGLNFCTEFGNLSSFRERGPQISRTCRQRQ